RGDSSGPRSSPSSPPSLDDLAAASIASSGGGGHPLRHLPEPHVAPGAGGSGGADSPLEPPEEVDHQGQVRQKNPALDGNRDGAPQAFFQKVDRAQLGEAEPDAGDHQNQ